MNRAAFFGGIAIAVALSGYLTFVSTKDVPPANATPKADASAVVLVNVDASVTVEPPLPVPTLDFDASAVPPAPALTLTETSSKSVKFGVVLVQFAGAQDAPASARGRAAAKQIADKIAAEAKTDFHAAVTHGDPGSTDDAGRIHRGVLEPDTERVLFGLGQGDVSEPIETPRGYWVVKRLD